MIERQCKNCGRLFYRKPGLVCLGVWLQRRSGPRMAAMTPNDSRPSRVPGAAQREDGI